MNATRRNRTWLVSGLTVTALVLLLLLVGETNRQQVPQISAARVTRESLNVSISSNGKVEPIEPHTVQSKLTTFVEKVFVVEGQSVKRGQLLLTLDPSEIRTELTRMQEELVGAQQDLQTAQGGGRADEVAQVESDLRKAEVERAHLKSQREALDRLLSKQAATRQELDQNKLALDRVEAESRALQQKKAELARRARADAERATLRAGHARDAIRSLEEKLAAARITAPVDGTLFSLRVGGKDGAGDPVRAGQFVRVGDMLAEVADLRRVQVRTFVDEPDLGLLAEGQDVEITWDAYPHQTWNGRVARVPKNVFSRGTRTVGEVLCSVSNDKLELLPNINVDVRIRVLNLANALTVPRGAVRSQGPEHYVFVVEGEKLARRPIKVGTVSATKCQVLGGLAEGDRVALPGEVELRDGLLVRPVDQK
ncbi:MAG TPA: efflux RND transporter periplasmic adaptor subunit [Acidobacteriota bacterium]|jgi:HlyD family secretion protein